MVSGRMTLQAVNCGHGVLILSAALRIIWRTIVITPRTQTTCGAGLRGSRRAGVLAALAISASACLQFDVRATMGSPENDQVAARRDYASQSNYPSVQPNVDTVLSGTIDEKS